MKQFCLFTCLASSKGHPEMAGCVRLQVNAHLPGVPHLHVNSTLARNLYLDKLSFKMDNSSLMDNFSLI